MTRSNSVSARTSRARWPTSCSTERPAFVFYLDGRFHAHVLNVGDATGVSGYNTDSHLLYWAICHQKVVRAEDLAHVVARLGERRDAAGLIERGACGGPRPPCVRDTGRSSTATARVSTRTIPP